MTAYDVVEQTAREAYGRLVSFLAVNWRDIDAAQDAIADAFVLALERWPHTGVPDKPEAWLLTAARRKLIDQARRNRVYDRIAPTLLLMSEEAEQSASSDMPFPDERLKMLFLCAHPGIDAKARTPLMLQSVLGIDAARIASAFTVKPSTMGQRLIRAKTKIRTERMSFNMPDAEELPQRIASVLEAIYAAYGSGWDEVTEMNPHRKGLAEEAIYLGRLLSQSMPDEPEVQGLLALMLHFEARRDARLDEFGAYVPLSEQNPYRWSKALIQEAERFLNKAAQAGRTGRFQLLAAIQSVHAQRAWTGRTEWAEISLLYEGVARIAPTLGVLVGRAAAVAEAYGAERGFMLLEAIPVENTLNYQPYWALAAHLLTRMNRVEEARSANSRAIGLCSDPTLREYLKRQARQI